MDTLALIERAAAARTDLFDERHEAALRLFNGFYEGLPELAIDLYARTAVLHNYADDPATLQPTLDAVQAWLVATYPWLTAVVVKERNEDGAERNGRVVWGDEAALARKVREGGVWYAVDVLLNRDASLYLDTRNLRRWLKFNMTRKSVLNTFAYTGSLGVAAQASEARKVVHTDLSRAFLNIAKTSYSLNGFPIDKLNFKAGDFWVQIEQMKGRHVRFDAVIVDPPLFSATPHGTVDLLKDNVRVINKVRPLIDDGGWLIVVNNALFLPGAEFHAMLQELCADGYLRIDRLIDVPPDFTGYPDTIVGAPPVDPAPFNHPTKIAVLAVKRKTKKQH